MSRIQNMLGTLSREVQRLGCEIVHSEIADDRHAVIVTDQPQRDAAVRLSKALPGCVFIGGSHISWASSNFAVAVHTVDTWEKLAPVRAATSFILDGAPARFGIGACARQLIAWLGEPEPANPRLKGYVSDWHYQRCVPGRTDDAYQFDLSACYFNILKRLPSIALTFCDDEIFWRHTPVDEAERFRVIVDTVEYVKPLRNALIGAMFGGSNQVFLKAGKPQRFKTAPGARPSIAVAVVRTAYEVCMLQAEISEACYANADSIISPHDDPSFWRGLNLPYKLVARGVADIQAIGKYKVGEKATKTYTDGKAGAVRIRRDTRRVEPIYWRWLTASTPLLA